MLWTICPNGPRGQKFTVPSAQATIAGHWHAPSGKLLMPDPDAIAKALPYRWRAAFARSSGRFWFNDPTSNKPQKRSSAPYLTLYSWDGKRALVTLYALPQAEARV